MNTGIVISTKAIAEPMTVHFQRSTQAATGS
jgi:hypothetical protein